MEIVKECGLERHWSKFQLLGVRSVADLRYVEDSDLLAFGCTVIERRKFFERVPKNEPAEPSRRVICDPEERALRLLEHYGPMTRTELQKRLDVIGGILPPEGALNPRIVSDGEFLSLRETLWVFSQEVHLLRIASFLEPRELILFGQVNTQFWRSSTNKELWELHCKKWFPKASMIDPDTPERLDTAAALQSLQQMMQDGPKTLEQLACAGDESELLHLMAAHSDFREKDGYYWQTSDETWDPVNPYRVKSKPASVKKLDPRRAFRLYSTNLLEQRPGKRNLKPWQYRCHEGAAIGTLAPNDLLDLAQQRVAALHSSDPKDVHQLVKDTMDGVLYHIEGCYNRRVQLLFNALVKVRLDKEEKKRWERKKIDFMAFVKKERAFGYYWCKACNSRWKSGFTYEAIGQECRHCKAEVKPYRVEQLRVLFTPAGKAWDTRKLHQKNTQVIIFDGNAKSVDIYPHIRHGFPLKELTFSAWVKADEHRDNSLFQLGDLALTLDDNGGLVFYQCVGSLPLKKWAHICVTFSSNKRAAMVLDGEQVGSCECGTVTGRQAFLGSGQEYFKGQMSHVLIWSHVLSPSEIATVYTSRGMPKVDAAPLMALIPDDHHAVSTVIEIQECSADFRKDLEVLATRFDVAVEIGEKKITVMGSEAKVKAAGDEAKAISAFYKAEKSSAPAKNCEDWCYTGWKSADWNGGWWQNDWKGWRNDWNRWKW